MAAIEKSTEGCEDETLRHPHVIPKFQYEVKLRLHIFLLKIADGSSLRDTLFTFKVVKVHLIQDCECNGDNEGNK